MALAERTLRTIAAPLLVEHLSRAAHCVDAVPAMAFAAIALSGVRAVDTEDGFHEVLWLATEAPLNVSALTFNYWSKLSRGQLLDVMQAFRAHPRHAALRELTVYPHEFDAEVTTRLLGAFRGFPHLRRLSVATLDVAVAIATASAANLRTISVADELDDSALRFFTDRAGFPSLRRLGAQLLPRKLLQLIADGGGLCPLSRRLIDLGALGDGAQTTVPALHIAVKTGDLNTTRLLLENGADPNARDIFGDTALHKVCRHASFVDIVALLVASGGDPYARGR